MWRPTSRLEDRLPDVPSHPIFGLAMSPPDLCSRGGHLTGCKLTVLATLQLATSGPPAHLSNLSERPEARLGCLPRNPQLSRGS